LGNELETEFCLKTANNGTSMCKLPGSYVNVVLRFDWPFTGNEPLGSGVIGLQEFQSPDVTDLYSVVINYSNLTDWSFVAPDYIPTFYSSIILTQTPTPPPRYSVNIEFLAETLFGEFGFGIKYANDSAYYQPILDASVVPMYFSTLEQGLVVPFRTY
jgi:hypothetical protein